jgi:CRISPR/Cas system-associated protein Csm6
MMNHCHIPPVELAPGIVHRIIVDLVRIGIWTEQQADATPHEARRRQLGTATLACRLAAEVIQETLCVPVVVPPCDGANTSSAE